VPEQDTDAVSAELPRNANPLLQNYVTGQLIGQLLRRATAAHGLSGEEFAVQSVVNAIGPITPTALARTLGTPPTTLSAHIRRLTARGQLTRRRNPDDGRSFLLETTDSGRETVLAIAPAFDRLLRDVERRLAAPAEVRAAMQALQDAVRAQLADTADR
jgi:DNA-binding MarR family transcriptional regulator